DQTRLAAYRRIVAEHLSVRQTEALVSTGVPTPSRPRVRKDPAQATETKSPHLLDLEQALHRRLGTTVLIRPKSPERGQIIIDYHSREEFDRLADLFRSSVPEFSSP